MSDGAPMPRPKLLEAALRPLVDLKEDSGIIPKLEWMMRKHGLLK